MIKYTSNITKPGTKVAEYNNFNVIWTIKGTLVKQCGKWVKPCKR